MTDLVERARQIIISGCGCDMHCEERNDGCGCRDDALAIIALVLEAVNTAGRGDIDASNTGNACSGVGCVARPARG
jgi:hypothetical protein